MEKTRHCKVLVIGGGPGGYVAAIRAGQLGLDTVIVEADRYGGTCLIRGCIPSKALIHAASRFEALASHAQAPRMGISLNEPPTLDLAELMAWKDGIVDQLNHGVVGLLKRAGVEMVKGWAEFSDGKTCKVKTAEGIRTITAEHVILATGSEATELPFLPFGDPIISSDKALSPEKLPERLVIIGAGYIGLELGVVYRKLGCNVTFVEAEQRILPLFDHELTRPLEKWLKRHDIAIYLGAQAKSLVEVEGGYSLEFEDSEGKLQQVPTDQVLVTVGRRPNTQGWGLENMAVDLDGSFIKVDDQCRTSMKNVWAIGDLAGEPMLAHKATFQGEMVAEIIAGQARRFDPRGIPSICFTEPELVGIGLTPDEARELNIQTVVGRFPFAANGRALTMEAGVDGGFIRITARHDNHLVLGVHAVGLHISELAGEFTLALEMGARLEDLFGTIHAHPSLGEAIPEAALSALHQAIHVAN